MKQNLTRRARGDVGKSGGLALTGNGQDCAEQLARFFPHARPIRIPVQVITRRGGSTSLREAAVVEYGGPEHAIFVAKLPLEVHDRVPIEATEEGRPTEATVLGVQ